MSVNRNAPCPCGSGKKYKHCCGSLAENTPGSTPVAPVIAKQPAAVAAANPTTVIALFNAGRFQEMEAAARALTGLHPDDSMAWFLLGVALLVRNQNQAAIDPLRRALALKPDFADAYGNLGNALQNLGQLDEAIASYHQALMLKPDFADAHSNLGNALSRLGRLDEAVACYQRALAIRPDFADASFNLGNSLKSLGRMDEAAACYRHALSLQPRLADAHNNLGNILQNQGRLEEAAVSYQQALAIRPDAAETLNNLGNVFRDLGRLDEAVASYQRALALKPDMASAHGNLGNALQALGKTDEAMASYQRALALKPEMAEMQVNLGNALQDTGQPDAANIWYQRAVATSPERLGYKLAAAINLPVITESRNHIASWREHYAAETGKLAGDPAMIDNPLNAAGAPAFYLAYHDENDRPSMESLCHMFRSRCPALNYRAPHLQAWQAPARTSRRLRVGFLSECLGAHTIGKLYQGLIRELDRQRFEVVVLHAPAAKKDSIREQIDRMADRAIALPHSFSAMQQAVADTELDVLFYPDIGMHHTSYFLAYSRLAPVQAVSWGHPDTTGIDTMDYFLSAASIEPENADEHYSERLIRFKRLPCYYEPFVKPSQVTERAALGLPEKGTLYGCPQTLFKFHPDFDKVLADIADGDPDGRIVLIEGKHKDWSRLLRARWEKSAPQLPERVLFIPRMPLNQFMAVMAHMDVLLDPVHFGSGNTLYEAMVYGIPMVTWPGRFMRGRLVAGAYRQMGIGEAPVAGSIEDYASVALGLGKNAERRESLSKALLAAAQTRLFADLVAVREFEDFLTAAVDAAARGERLPTGWSPSLSNMEE
ncbi:MAG: tetratricopeptide repeat protein [Gammaproteobacteria bacterium]|nr:tetratricopeptide repeat protein [Gammaproteobacteria bacterium]MBU1732233.1 tetratricopeptide repeat protein [Gammaproteobacteria bacterium]MBU1893237.1 tetratricopeptide repeat protein [Gammaproteobacteria bacterium]